MFCKHKVRPALGSGLMAWLLSNLSSGAGVSHLAHWSVTKWPADRWLMGKPAGHWLWWQQDLIVSFPPVEDKQSCIQRQFLSAALCWEHGHDGSPTLPSGLRKLHSPRLRSCINWWKSRTGFIILTPWCWTHQLQAFWVSKVKLWKKIKPACFTYLRLPRSFEGF